MKGFALIDGKPVLFAINAPDTKMARLLSEGAEFVPADDERAEDLAIQMGLANAPD